jgi:hypothetical protein
VRANALKGRRFKSLSEENLFLRGGKKQTDERAAESKRRLLPIFPMAFPASSENRFASDFRQIQHRGRTGGSKTSTRPSISLPSTSESLAAISLSSNSFPSSFSFKIWAKKTADSS